MLFIQTDRQTHKYTDRHIHTYIHTDRHSDRQIDRHTDSTYTIIFKQTSFFKDKSVTLTLHKICENTGFH